MKHKGGKHKAERPVVPDERFYNPRTAAIKTAIRNLSDEDQEEILAYTARIIDEAFWKQHTVNGQDRAGNINEPWDQYPLEQDNLVSNIDPITLNVQLDDPDKQRSGG